MRNRAPHNEPGPAGRQDMIEEPDLTPRRGPETALLSNRARLPYR
jgi:hypothetical protein